METFDKQSHVEVHQQTHAVAAGLQIRQDLRLVDGPEFPDRLHFDDDSIFHDQIEAMLADQLAAIANLDQFLYVCP